jgi:hypothetical protein
MFLARCSQRQGSDYWRERLGLRRTAEGQRSNMSAGRVFTI